MYKCLCGSAVLAAIAALYFFHVRLEGSDLPFYRKLVQESLDLHAHSALEKAPVRQMRSGVRKDIWTIKEGARLHSRIACAQSDMTFTQAKGKIEAVEICRGIEAWMDEGKHLTAESGVCHFPTCRMEMNGLAADCKEARCAAQKTHWVKDAGEIQCSDGVEIEAASGIRAVGASATLRQDSLQLFPAPGSMCSLFHGNDRIDAKEIRCDGASKELICLSPHGCLEESRTVFDAATGRAQFLKPSCPSTLYLEGNVQIASRFQDKESFALADSAAFHVETKKIVLESAPLSRILFRQEDLEISAPTVHIQGAIQGFGDVRFFFYPEEKIALDTIFSKFL